MSTKSVYDYNDVVLNARSLRDQYAPYVSYELFKCPDGCMSCTVAFPHKTLDISIAVACPKCLKEWLVCSMCTNIRKHMMRNWYINRHLRDKHPEIQFDPKENKVRCFVLDVKKRRENNTSGDTNESVIVNSNIVDESDNDIINQDIWNELRN